MLVLPKLSAYQYKDIDTKIMLEKIITEWAEFLKENNISIRCFAEDMLAVTMLKNEPNIKWFTTLGSSDTNFLLTSVGEYPQEYQTIQKIPVDSSILKESMTKHKTRKSSEYIDQLEFRGARLTVLSNRIRYVANKVLDECSFIVYINANNNYCAVPQSFVGDGRFCVVVDLKAYLTFYTFGGVNLKKEEFETIVRSMRL